MDFINNAVCPISNIKINNYVNRVAVFINVVLLALYLLTGIPYLVAFVVIDYGIRAWNPNYSPLWWIAVRIVKVAKLPEKRTDQAPKLFGARLGFIFALISLLLIPISLTASMIIATMVLVIAALDSVFDFCVGCVTYAYIVLPFYQSKGIRGR